MIERLNAKNPETSGKDRQGMQRKYSPSLCEPLRTTFPKFRDSLRFAVLQFINQQI
jgi:hypothetical protein